MFYDHYLRLLSRKYKVLTSKYDSKVVIYTHRGFIRLATVHISMAKDIFQDPNDMKKTIMSANVHLPAFLC